MDAHVLEAAYLSEGDVKPKHTKSATENVAMNRPWSCVWKKQALRSGILRPAPAHVKRRGIHVRERDLPCVDFGRVRIQT